MKDAIIGGRKYWRIIKLEMKKEDVRRRRRFWRTNVSKKRCQRQKILEEKLWKVEI